MVSLLPSLIIDAVVLMVLLWTIAPTNAPLEFERLFWIALAVAVVGFALEILLGSLPALVPQILAGAFLCWLLVQYCNVTFRQAAIVSSLYFVLEILIGFFLDLVIRLISRVFLN
jgi:hypothetical protein